MHRSSATGDPHAEHDSNRQRQSTQDVQREVDPAHHQEKGLYGVHCAPLLVGAPDLIEAAGLVLALIVGCVVVTWWFMRR